MVMCRCAMIKENKKIAKRILRSRKLRVLRFYQELFFYKLKNRIRNALRFREIWKAAKERKQSCNRCGNEIYFDFTVGKDYWNLVRLKYKNKVLCINCFIKLTCKELKLKDFQKFFIVK